VILLAHLTASMPEMRLILVVRHGLDMAFSRNQNHVRLWGGALAGLDPTEDLTPEMSLDWWIRANSQAIADGTAVLGDRLLVVNDDRLCVDPRPDIAALLALLDVEGDLDDLSRAPEGRLTAGRHREHPIARFRRDQLEAVADLGFEVPSIARWPGLRRLVQRRKLESESRADR
jgi:hypothetical protein